jgi:hypothetical protein
MLIPRNLQRQIVLFIKLPFDRIIWLRRAGVKILPKAAYSKAVYSVFIPSESVFILLTPPSK